MSGTRAGALKGWETRRLMHRPTKRNEARQERKGERGARVSVRPHNFHGQSGYLISGRDKYNRSISIFARTKPEAERIRQQVKNDQEVTFDKGPITAEEKAYTRRVASAKEKMHDAYDAYATNTTKATATRYEKARKHYEYLRTHAYSK